MARPSPDGRDAVPSPSPHRRTLEPDPPVKIQEADAKSLLVAQGLPVPAWEVAHTVAEARAAAERILAGRRRRRSSSRPRSSSAAAARPAASSSPRSADEAERGRGGDPRDGHQGHHGPQGAGRRGGRHRPASSTCRPSSTGPAGRILLMGSAEGGVEIEQVAVDHPEAIIRHHADPLLGLLDFQAREFAFAMGLGGAPEGGRRDRQGPRPDDARLRRRPRRDQPAGDRPRDRRRTAPPSSGSSASTPRSRSTTPRSPAIPVSRSCATPTRRTRPTARRARPG